MSKEEEKSLAPESLLVSAGRSHQPGSPLNTPIVPASNFVLGGHHEYARDNGTPTWEALEDIIGGLEGGKAVAFASGMAAIAAVFDQLQSGALVVLPDDCYQGVAGLATEGECKGYWRLHRLPVSDTQGWVSAAEGADLIWLESPSNPLLEVADLYRICQAKRKPGSIVSVDNTFATPLNQRPLDLGADFSIHSATKFIGGHSDLLAGVAVTKDLSKFDRLQKTRSLSGGTPGVLESFLAVRGVRTMALRLNKAQNTALELAKRLRAHPSVTKVRYPGLTSHPTHDIALVQLKGFGTMISFDVNGNGDTADAVCDRIELIQHATSLGAVESTMERRAKVSGQEHLPETLLRLSVGIEDVEDLWADLQRALP